jgi:glycine cleavage system H protein
VKYAVLSCSGMDKTEGSLAREVAIRLAEIAGAEIICPVLLNRSPARYKRLLSENPLVVVDGCGTRCAGKLTASLDARAERKILISDVLKVRGLSPGTSLRLDPDNVALAETIAVDLLADLAAPAAPPETAVAADGQTWEAPGDLAIVVHDKFEFRIPRSGYFFNENDVWVRPSGVRGRVGISDYMQQRLTDLTYFDPPHVGAEFEQFGEAGSVESTKAAFEIISPVGGRVVAINQEVVDAPQLVNEDPYGRGWLVEVELVAWQEDKELLLGGADYAKTVEQKAAEE